MWKTLMLIGIGGGLGSILRYLSGLYAYKYLPGSFPWGTMMVNVSGCFLIGLLLGCFGRYPGLDPDWKLLLVVGFCGGFTTFSAFSMESLSLFQSHQVSVAFLYLVASVVGGLAATMLGFFLTK